MPTAEFFNQFEILTVRNFLDSAVCLQLCDEMRAARQLKGVYNGVETHRTTPEDKFTGPRVVTQLPDASVRLVEDELLKQLPKLEKHFQIKLNGIEPAGFAVYKKNCGFKPHFDAARDDTGYGALRKVSVVIFLNQETDESPTADSYCGGNLTFYGLIKNEALAKFGLSLTGERGMLVAFSSKILHEVTPVTAGERFVVVGWYF